MTPAKLALSLFFAASPSFAQIQTQPTEIIRATPLSSFSERAGGWPTTVVPNDVIPSETTPLSYFLNTLPGVQAREQGSPTLSIRGSAQAGRTLKLFDGVPLVFGDGFGAPANLIPNEILGELRLFKGPASVFYGPFALAGALNHIPRVFERPAVRLAGANSGGGSTATNALGVVPLRWGENGDFVQLSAFTENDPGDFPFESVSSGLSGRRLNNKTHTNRFTLLGSQTLSRVTIRERLIYAESLGTNPDIVTAPSPSSFERKSALASIDASFRLSQSTDLAIKLSHLRHDSRDKSSFFDTHSEMGRSLASFDFGWIFGPLVQSRTFLDVSYDTLDTRGFITGDFHQNALELGEIVEIPLAKGWMLQPGARWLSQHGRIFPSFAAIHDTESERQWVTYAEGFRAPSLYDRYSRSNSYAPNPALKPESSRQIEAGFLEKPKVRHRTFMEGFSWGGSLYAIEYREFFDNQPVSASVSTKINRGDAYAYGGEVSAGFAEGTRTYSLSYNHLQGRNRATGEPLTLAPRHQVTAILTQSLGPFVIEVKDTYWSETLDREFPSNRLVVLPDWNIVDFGVRSVGFSDWEFKAGVQNIFDRARELTLGYPEKQRTAYAAVLRYF